MLEETLKLAPLAVLGVLAPGRMRRFGATDWLLLGLACGYGFQAAEDFVRRVVPKTQSLDDLLAQLQGRSLGPHYGWTLFGGQADLYGVATYAGHGIETGLVAAGIGLAVRLAWGRRRRLLLWLLPAALWLLAVGDHAGYNATSIDRLAFPEGRTTVPSAIRTWWAWTGHGVGRGWLLLGLLVLAVLADASAQARRPAPAALASILAGRARAAADAWRRTSSRLPTTKLLWSLAGLSVERRRREFDGAPMRPGRPWVATRVSVGVLGAVLAGAGIAGAVLLADRIGYNLYQRTGLNSGGLLDPILGLVAQPRPGVEGARRHRRVRRDRRRRDRAGAGGGGVHPRDRRERRGCRDRRRGSPPPPRRRRHRGQRRRERRRRRRGLPTGGPGRPRPRPGRPAPPPLGRGTRQKGPPPVQPEV